MSASCPGLPHQGAALRGGWLRRRLAGSVVGRFGTNAGVDQRPETIVLKRLFGSSGFWLRHVERGACCCF